MEDIFLRQCRESRYQNQGKSDGRGGKFSNPFIGFYEGRTYRQPEVVFISLPQAANGLCCACRARSVGMAFSRTCSCRRRHSYAEDVPANALSYHQSLLLQEINDRYGRRGGEERWQYFILQ